MVTMYMKIGVVSVLAFYTIYILVNRHGPGSSRELNDLRDRLATRHLAGKEVLAVIAFIARSAAAWPVVIYTLIRGDKPSND